MPTGDWGVGSKLEPVMVTITLDPNLRIAHYGIGYHIVTPSGKRHDGGFTPHCPGNNWYGPENHVNSLQRLIDELLGMAAEHEGVSLMSA